MVKLIDNRFSTYDTGSLVKIDESSMLNCKSSVDNASTNLNSISTNLDSINVPYHDVMYQISLAKKNISLVEEKLLDLSRKLGSDVAGSLEIGTNIISSVNIGAASSLINASLKNMGKNMANSIKTTNEKAEQLKRQSETTKDSEEKIPWWKKLLNLYGEAQVLNAEANMETGKMMGSTLTQGGLLFAEGFTKTGENIGDAFDFAKLKSSLTDEELLFLYQDLDSLQWEVGIPKEKQEFNNKQTFNATDMQEAMEQYFWYLGIDDTSMFFKDRTPEEEEEFRNSTVDYMSYDEVETVLLNFMYNNGYNIGENNDPVKNLDNRPMERYQLEQSFTRPVEINGMTPDEYLSANLGNLINLSTGPLSVLEYNGNFQERMLDTINPNGILTSKERSDYAMLGYYMAAKNGQSFAESIGLSNDDMKNILSGNQDILESQPNFSEDSVYYGLTNKEIGNKVLNTLKNSSGEVLGVNVNRREKGTTNKSGSTMISDENMPLFVEAMEDIAKDKTGDWFNQNIYEEALPFNSGMTWKEYLDENSLIHKDNLGGQVVSGIGAMMPSILANVIPVIGSTLSTAVLATSSYGGNVEENINLVKQYNPDLMEVDSGEVYNRVNKTSAVQAAITTILEKGINPSIGGFKTGDSKGLSKIVDDAIDLIPNNGVKKGVSVLWSGLTETFGEEIPDWFINSHVAANILVPENKDEVLKDFLTPDAFWNTVAVTMITSGILSSVSPTNVIQEQKEAYQFIKDLYDSQPENVKKLVADVEQTMGDAYRTDEINGVAKVLTDKISKLFNIQNAKAETNVTNQTDSKKVGIDFDKMKLVTENIINKVQSVVINKIKDEPIIKKLEKYGFNEQEYNSLSSDGKIKYLRKNIEKLDSVYLYTIININDIDVMLAPLKVGESKTLLESMLEINSGLLYAEILKKLAQDNIKIAEICALKGNFSFVNDATADVLLHEVKIKGETKSILKWGFEKRKLSFRSFIKPAINNETIAKICEEYGNFGHRLYNIGIPIELIPKILEKLDKYQIQIILQSSIAKDIFIEVQNSDSKYLEFVEDCFRSPNYRQYELLFSLYNKINGDFEKLSYCYEQISQFPNNLYYFQSDIFFEVCWNIIKEKDVFYREYSIGNKYHGYFNHSYSTFLFNYIYQCNDDDFLHEFLNDMIKNVDNIHILKQIYEEMYKFDTFLLSYYDFYEIKDSEIFINECCETAKQILKSEDINEIKKILLKLNETSIVDRKHKLKTVLFDSLVNKLTSGMDNKKTLETHKIIKTIEYDGKKIPIYLYDGGKFKFFIHGIANSRFTDNNSTADRKYKDLYKKPEIWVESENEEDSQFNALDLSIIDSDISVSSFSSTLKLHDDFEKDLTLVFFDIPISDIYFFARGDACTGPKFSGNSAFSKFFSDHDYLPSIRGMIEVLQKGWASLLVEDPMNPRYIYYDEWNARRMESSGRNRKPDAMILAGPTEKAILEMIERKNNILKWAAFFEIPIIGIDLEAYAKQKYDEIDTKFSQLLQNEVISAQLFESLYYDYNLASYYWHIPVYDQKFINNLNISINNIYNNPTYENAKNVLRIIDIMKKLSIKFIDEDSMYKLEKFCQEIIDNEESIEVVSISY